MNRTSASHPLQFGSISIGNGMIGVTLCPGKKGDSVFGAPWDRDIETDLNAIAGWGASTVLTLIEKHEMSVLGVRDLPEAIRAKGFTCHHLPIRDGDVPSRDFMQTWLEFGPALQRDLDGGKRILIHCGGGLGRAGTVAALLLIDRGIGAREAIARVREARPGAIETKEQEKWLLRHGAYASDRQRLLHASLLGGALGDSLGAEIEFKPLSAIRALFPNGVREIPPHDGKVGAITDDTQMTLFTAEGLIRAYVRGTLRGVCSPAGVVHHALLRWYLTQSRGRASHHVEIDTENGLVADPRLRVARAPGNTCLSALGLARGFGESARNDSKGCGTIMRVAPVGLGVAREEVHALSVTTSALTHGHLTGQMAAAAWAELLADVAAGKKLEDRARALALSYARLDGGLETAKAIRAALAASRDGRPETVESLGGGWVAEEALAIALYAALTARAFEGGLRIAVTHTGGSDSTGAIAGNLLGLLYPDEVLSHRWAWQIECADLINRLSRDLAAAPNWMENEAEERWPIYPGW